MKIRLAGGVVVSGRNAWIARPSGPVRLLDQAGAAPGDAVALGPAEAPDADVARAVRELTRLVAEGGVVAAGAGVDLGAGFRSARLDGALVARPRPPPLTIMPAPLPITAGGRS